MSQIVHPALGAIHEDAENISAHGTDILSMVACDECRPLVRKALVELLGKQESTCTATYPVPPFGDRVRCDRKLGHEERAHAHEVGEITVTWL